MSPAEAFSVNEALARHLIHEQFPELAPLPLIRQTTAGTAHALFRLGSDLVARFPMTPAASLQCEKEHRWLREIATALPVPVPVPIHMGSPSNHYPAQWSITRWFAGRAIWDEPSLEWITLAVNVANFIKALSAIPPMGGPGPGAHNFGRGIDLSERDRPTREALCKASEFIPANRLEALWDRALSAMQPQSATWIHGDLHGGNMIMKNGILAAVIDFGGLAVGDPACDLAFAWYVLDRRGRERFRSELGANDDLWLRAKGWALSVAAIQLPYYRKRNTRMEELATRTLSAILDDET
ncbi:MAG: aminoglycoside phosphotransferase family protein [Planctomycetota bacterium]